MRKVGSCMVGEQAATTTRVTPSSLMSFLMRSWPGSEHMYLYSRATATLGCVGGPLDDLVDVDLAGDVAAAVAEVDADLLFSHRHLLLAAHAGIAASTPSQETTCLSMASFLGFDAEREAGELGEVHDRDVEVGAEGGVDPRLVGLEVHLAQRAGGDDDVGAACRRAVLSSSWHMRRAASSLVIIIMPPQHLTLARVVDDVGAERLEEARPSWSGTRDRRRRPWAASTGSRSRAPP